MRQQNAWTALKFKASAPVLLKEFRAVETQKMRYRHKIGIGKNYAISLVSSTGEQSQFLPFSRGKPYAATALGKQVPRTLKLVNSLPGPLFSVRYLISEPDAGLLYHRDHNVSAAFGIVRLHIPLITNKAARFYVEDQNFHLAPGSLYFVDVGRFHAIENRSQTARVHLVIDIGWTRELEKIFPRGFLRALQKMQKPSYFPWPKASVGKPSLTPGTYRIAPEVRPESLKFQKSDKFKLICGTEGCYFLDQKKVRYNIERLNREWCYCPSLGPGFRFKKSGRRLLFELNGVIKPLNNGRTQFVKIKRFAAAL